MTKPIRANRILGLSILGGMFLIAGAGLALALATQQTRREHDKGLPAEMLQRRQKRNTSPETPVNSEPGGER